MEEKLTKDERKAIRKEEWKEQLKREERNNFLKRIGFIVGAVVVIVVAFWAIIAFTGSAASNHPLITTMPAVSANDLQMGPTNSKATLVEYADFQCPACGAYYPLVKQLTTAYQGKLHFVYRTFPLTQVHQNALVSSEAAIAAGKQGKFWEMHDVLFAHQSDWATQTNYQPIFDSYAQQLGLNIEKFHTDMNDPKTKQYIMDEENAGLNIGIDSTPTFFLNGKQIQNPQSYDEFKTIIQNALNG